MVRDEAKVKVRLDTKQAKGELRGLTKEGSKTAGRVGAGIRSALSRGIGVVGLGALAGVGFSAARGALRGPTESGIGAIAGEMFGGLGHRFAQGALGAERLAQAAGAARARQEIIQGYAHVVGHRGLGAPLPGGMISDFQQRQRFHADEARGAGRIMADPALRDPMLSGPGELFLASKTVAFAVAIDSMIEWIKQSVAGAAGR
jgi:hypothetical protein